MRIKKINAALSLLATLALLIHIGYTVYAYLAFYYDPALKRLTSIPFMVLACLHAICGMAAVFLLPDGTRLDHYPRRNVSTVLQRLSAAMIFPLLILHLNTFDLLRACAERGRWVFFALAMLCQPLFYGTVLTHVAVSLTRALITLGWLSDRKKQRIIDAVVYLLCAFVFAVSVWAVLKGQLTLFLPAGGSA